MLHVSATGLGSGPPGDSFWDDFPSFFFHIVARCRARARALCAAHGQKPPPVLPGRLAAEEAPAEEAAEVSVRWAVLRLTLLRMMLLLLR